MSFCFVNVKLRELRRWQNGEFHVRGVLLMESLCRHWGNGGRVCEDEDTCRGACLQGELDLFYAHGLLMSGEGYSAERGAGEELGDCHCLPKV
ncbi:hypothetical protein AVEN_50487-1 [Araneus ventricosus]|uniref:Uncharacterized protein n=1 Tax=Araneus ventricosus TaxID=182803 RepID=A0A4Y2AQV8_ARAVE|nr:hypothetical protein AVEN_50487-1 [Araneus ventricosus]